ncbi:MAG: hypothetical protein MSH32_00140, partial [Lachnospiraceae bacterium]|nr:hypothetical protein [Lachnospiraceae bacterium]
MVATRLALFYAVRKKREYFMLWILVLVSLRSLLDDDHVVKPVLIDLKSAVLCKFYQIVADRLFMKG